MKKNDYKRVISKIKADSGLEVRLRQKLIKEKTNVTYKKPIFLKAAAMATVVVILILALTFLLPLLTETPNHAIEKPKANDTPNMSQSPKALDGIFSGFSVVAYAAGSDEAVLTANYRKETDPTVLEPEVEVLLPTYSPLMSSVPGLPFSIVFHEASGNEIAADTIIVSVDSGTLLTWDTTTFVVEVIGREVTLHKDLTLYWSPLEMGEEESVATMTFQAMKDGEMIGTQSIIIRQLDDMGNYAAKGEEPLAK